MAQYWGIDYQCGDIFGILDKCDRYENHPNFIILFARRLNISRD